MNEPRFIELLNLYVDQQLSPQEAIELEAEIQTNPVRHRTYQQYCRMQKACAQLFEHERSAAPASAALSRAMADADRKIVAFPAQGTRRAVWPVGFSVGAIAAAACVAFVVVLQNNPGGPAAGGEIAATEEKAAVVQADAAVLTAATAQEMRLTTATLAPVSSENFTSVFTVQPLRTAATRPEGLFVSGSAVDTQLVDWTREVQLRPLRRVSAEAFVFDQRDPVDDTLNTRFSPSMAEEPATEMNAFQFTK